MTSLLGGHMNLGQWDILCKKEPKGCQHSMETVMLYGPTGAAQSQITQAE